MKKNISINISLIIFYIEEDGYDRLKEYLESIQNYFSTFEDSTEIIADIESRIAGIFLSKLKESKQVITNKDVENLVSIMGSIQDFQAIEEQESSTFVEPAFTSIWCITLYDLIIKRVSFLRPLFGLKSKKVHIAENHAGVSMGR